MGDGWDVERRRGECVGRHRGRVESEVGERGMQLDAGGWTWSTGTEAEIDELG